MANMARLLCVNVVGAIVVGAALAFQPSAVQLRSRPRSAQALKMGVIMIPPSALPPPADMLPVFGERLVGSFGQLPDAHDSTLMAARVVIMTLVPALALLHMYAELNRSPTAQAAAVPVVSEVEIFDDDYFYTHTA